MTQPSLFEPTIQERFEQFHAEHPEVYAKLLELALDLRRRGFPHYGIRSLWERCRWHFQIDVGLGEDFKLNDHYHSRYARLLVERHPELDGFFELRALKSA